MRSLVVLVGISSAPIAAADAVVEGELSAGASSGGELRGAGDPSTFVLSRGHLLAEVTRTPRPLDERGLHLCSLDSAGCAWIFTSLDPTDIDGAGVEATTQLLYATIGDVTSALHLDGRAWARVAGWGVEVRSAFQPSTTLRDRFWRSNRGVLQTNLAFAIPPMWSLGTRQDQVSFMGGTVDLGSRTLHDDDRWHTVGFDRDIAVQGARVQTQHTTVDLLTFRYAELGAADRRSGGTTFGTSVVSMDIDMLAIDRKLPHDLALSGRIGVADRTPVAPFEETGSSSRSYGPSVFSVSYWLEARLGELDGEQRGFAFTAGGGSWLRLDPTGHAVDAGQLASAALAVRRRRLTIRADLQLGRLRRVLEGNLAPPGLVPVGTRMAMGRGSVQASFGLTRTLSLTGTAWLEHSDRDDPRWASPTAGPATHAGGDLVAVWMFRKGKKR